MREFLLTGTTTNDYVTTSIYSGHRRTTIALKNTGTADMYVTIRTRHKTDGLITFDEVTDALITARSTLRYVETKLISQVDILVKSAIADTPTTYDLEYGFANTEGR